MPAGSEQLFTWATLGTVTGLALVVSGIVNILASLTGWRINQPSAKETDQATPDDEKKTLRDQRESANRKTTGKFMAFAMFSSFCLVLAYTYIETPEHTGAKLALLVLANTIVVLAAAAGSNQFLKGAQDAISSTPAAKAVKAVTAAEFIAPPIGTLKDAQSEAIAKSIATMQAAQRENFFRSWA